MAGDNTYGISLPREAFAQLTPNAFLHSHLKEGVRPNGRKPDTFREPTVNTGSLSYSNGSAVVRLGDTAVVCGIRGEILLASDIPNASANEDIEKLGLLVTNIESSTGCSPAHLPGNPPSTQAQSLSWRLHSLLHVSDLVSLENLRIESEGETKAYWTLYLDMLCISLDGNCFDAAWIALVAALRDTTLPRAAWDVDNEVVVCSPIVSCACIYRCYAHINEAETASRLQLGSVPIPSTFAIYSTASALKDPSAAQSWALADPDTLEEETSKQTVTITVENDSIVRVEKAGLSQRKLMRHLFALARSRAKTIETLLSHD